MKTTVDRRSFLRVAGASLGIGALYQFAPMLVRGAAADYVRGDLQRRNGEAPSSFTFAQFSDTHVGFAGAPDPLGTRAFESAVTLLNRSPYRPDFVLFTGDLTHDVDDRDAHAARMRLFGKIAGGLKTRAIHTVPGENDAALDGGVLYREHFGEGHYSFDHKGVHFVALDNVSQGGPQVGAAQRAWLRADLARFSASTPIIVFTHRPLFDFKPEWEWFTRDGGAVMSVLAPYENVTVLYGHIHRHDVRQMGKVRHYAARSLIFAFDDPSTNETKKPLLFDPGDPFRDLGIRVAASQRNGGTADLGVNEIVLSKAEFSGLSGMQQMIRGGQAADGSSSDDAD
ncbi:MAG TPA: metallophosphoesterase [Candidatus Binataceae bacterium]|nr:metallophosphoesterase [Candidatus Binataceae bacterium]